MGYLMIPADFSHLPPSFGVCVTHTIAPRDTDAEAIRTAIKHLHKVRSLTSSRIAGHSRAKLIMEDKKKMAMKTPLSKLNHVRHGNWSTFS